MEDRFVTIDRCKIRYRDTGGAGMPVLLSHGIAGSLEMWGPQLQASFPQLRLIAWDAPNHGLSDLSGRVEDYDSYARWALKLADALALRRFVAVGNSMGAAVSLRLAGLAPARVAGLVLADAAGLGRGVMPVFRLFVLPFLGEAMNKPNDKSVDLQIGALVKDPASVGPDLRAAIQRNGSKPGGVTAFLATLRRMTGVWGQRSAIVQQSRDLLAALQCPVLFVHGRQDSVLPCAHSEAAAPLAPRSQLLVFEDCGHTPQIEKPAEFNAALADFVARLA